MKNDLQIQAVMHPFPHSVGLDQSLRVAKEMMQEHSVRHLAVQKGGKLVGIISDRDINYALAMDKKSAGEETVEEAYTSEPYIVEPKEKVSHVARRMASDHIGCALIAENDALVGIFTTVDACRSLAESLSGEYDQ